MARSVGMIGPTGEFVPVYSSTVYNALRARRYRPEFSTDTANLAFLGGTGPNPRPLDPAHQVTLADLQDGESDPMLAIGSAFVAQAITAVIASIGSSFDAAGAAASAQTAAAAYTNTAVTNAAFAHIAGDLGGTPAAPTVAAIGGVDPTTYAVQAVSTAPTLTVGGVVDFAVAPTVNGQPLAGLTMSYDPVTGNVYLNLPDA